ncbi:hypothetical protein MAR_009350 [Mya arenaria]|uniref:Uncharacterized protein n=1 Tax=Mya arenaria TaxID=6604 RepID=A0ABY7E1F3_MYAAR|nr:hypothetical protein MAR_009350 [Mya arenaria]
MDVVANKDGYDSDANLTQHYSKLLNKNIKNKLFSARKENMFSYKTYFNVYIEQCLYIFVKESDWLLPNFQIDRDFRIIPDLCIDESVKWLPKPVY